MSLLQKSRLAGLHGVYYSDVSGVRTGLQPAAGDRAGVFIRDDENICGTSVSQAHTFPLRPSGHLPPDVICVAAAARSPLERWQGT